MAKKTIEEDFDALFKRFTGGVNKFFRDWGAALDEATERDNHSSNKTWGWSTQTLTSTQEPLNPPIEYKVVEVAVLQHALKKFGADGWDLVQYQDGVAIFSRLAENETEESGSEDV